MYINATNAVSNKDTSILALGRKDFQLNNDDTSIKEMNNV